MNICGFKWVAGGRIRQCRKYPDHDTAHRDGAAYVALGAEGSVKKPTRLRETLEHWGRLVRIRYVRLVSVLSPESEGKK